MSEVAAIVVSAGLGRRLGKNKTFVELSGKPLISWSVAALHASKSIGRIVLVLHKEFVTAGRKLAAQNGWSKVTAVCEGGNLRQDSVRNGLDEIDGCDWVLIHDGARPFLTGKLIEDGIRTALVTGAAAAAVEVKDTIKVVDDFDMVTRTLTRDRLRAAQTPQVFRVDLLKKAYELAKGEFTDDAAIMENAGHEVKLYQGDYNNIKITVPEDLAVAEVIARGRMHL